MLRRHLPAVLAAGDYVSTHRDVEPWNVLMTGSGPALVDWDTAGPEMVRRVAILLGRLAERLRMPLGEQPLGERIATPAAFAEQVRGGAVLPG
ncbi:phosphotransferase [Actinoplanes sp. NPDC049681]|uniref:phosphotransferase n=1 Tax=Actinoplanes sp. NPDC049681 TaxID=3363905 RepID=UPI0037927FE1